MTLFSTIIINMKLEEYLEVICEFLRDYLVKSHMDGYVLGVSGGVDSSVVAAILKKAVGKEKVHCIMIPINSIPADLNDGLTLVNDLDLNYSIIDGSESFNKIIEQFDALNISLDHSTKGNYKARMRMSILYAYAQKHRYLVVGTDNKDESYIGYFTKYGDGGVDVLPIVHLTKGEVREIGRMLGVRSSLVARVPSAGLYEGQTDEGELGFSYDECDDYLLGKEVRPEAKERIEYWHRITEHKRAPIPSPEEFIR